METGNLMERIKALEARLEEYERPSGPDFSPAEALVRRNSAGRTDISDIVQDKVVRLTLPTAANTIPKVRECNFLEFKNRFVDGFHGHYAVDALVSGRLLEEEILEEQRFRERRTAARKETSRDEKKGTAILKAENQQNVDAFQNAQTEKWIRNVRLQSPALLMIMSKTQGEPWSNRPRTYERPFTSLFYFHNKMKEALAELEDHWAHCLDTDSSPDMDASPDMDSSPDTTIVKAPDNTQDAGSDSDAGEAIDDCPAALAVMRAYVRFVEKRLMPDYNHFVDLDFSSNAQVRFTDLWYLFRTGEFIYRPLEGGLARQQYFQTGKRIWKTYRIEPCAVQYRPTPSDHGGYETDDEDSADFIIRAYYLEYTGEEFCPAVTSFRIIPYENSVPVSSLPVFPIRFLPNWQSVLGDSQEDGNKALHYIETKHASYSGWSVIRTPAGDEMTDASGEKLNRAEHINGDVMVDFSEAFQACPHWKPTRKVLRPEKAVPKIVSDEFPIIWWANKNRIRPLAEITEIVPLVTGVHMRQQNEFLLQDRLLSKLIENDNRGKLSTAKYLREEDKCLLAGRVFGYVFQERKFVGLEILRMWQSSGTRDALDSLRIPAKTKDLIQRSVQGHLLQKSMERLDGQQQNLDMIHGKGGGLFILLYGVPGVGKTATAEAIAQANGKPLFKITCGDLGLTPDKVEMSLKEIFRLAGVWDCILLLDEVDTFFSSRSKGDSAMQKNALVSVFLSIMDYYTGILFLTTNLVGALDEAFKSRIHCKINYRALSKQQTIEIWENNIRRMRWLDEEQRKVESKMPLEIPESDIMRFARDQYDELNRRKRTGGIANNGWNGRQIRNACQIARSLAYADAAKEEEDIRKRSSVEGVPLPARMPGPRLQLRHFCIIRDISDSFDKYMVEARAGMTDSEVARENEVRADHYVDTWTAQATADSEELEGYNDGSSLGHGRQRPYFDARPRPPNSPAIGQGLRGNGSNGGFYTYQEGRAPQNRQSPLLTTPANGPSIMFSSSERGEYERQLSPLEASPRMVASPFQPRGRDSTLRRGEYEYEPEYGNSRNSYGKRERLSDDNGPVA
ncbi:aaa family ATPase [Grosmannia clavigera kw1407]|uniref:Aaa family ATPase n=1 Tax=Grosmannia clavigera (strain kw1407 / UAMH 11150) TaxID=655863 RepID=F0XCM3_GROCL|nr:aaa family ATPase [Grosmannia clavigera kw1407]EFX03991.1 aaa family ATPase [Grosmannia clavigera kw1407]